MRHIALISLFILFSSAMTAQTASSLFLKKDGKQVSEIVSDKPVLTEELGHGGPAVENTHMALRLLCNANGTVDVYSKTGRGLELRQFQWYPSVQDQETQGLGCDVYNEGSDFGFGGIALWDAGHMVKLEATGGRTARAGDLKNGSYAEVLAYGVPYRQDTVDISIRIEVSTKSRVAVLTAKELSGKEVQFLTGINYWKNMAVKCGNGFIFTWGEHPLENSEAACAVGAGLFYNPSQFGPMEVKENMIWIVSRPDSEISTRLVAASTKEAELNNLKRFESYMTK